MRHFVSHLSPGRGPFPSKFPNFGLQNVPIVSCKCGREPTYSVWWYTQSYQHKGEVIGATGTIGQPVRLCYWCLVTMDLRTTPRGFLEYNILYLTGLVALFRCSCRPTVESHLLFFFFFFFFQLPGTMHESSLDDVLLLARQCEISHIAEHAMVTAQLLDALEDQGVIGDTDRRAVLDEVKKVSWECLTIILFRNNHSFSGSGCGIDW